jgi:hypothetical protein
MPWWPDTFTIPKKEKTIATVSTYTSAVVFSWGADIVGKKIDLEWEWMSEAQFDQLQTLYEADAAVEWDPNRPGVGGMTYNVEILSCDGEYFEVVDEDMPHRKKVKLQLFVLSEAGYGVGS